MAAADARLVIGWQEWCALPAIGIPAILAKIDTGAKTSALHALEIKLVEGSAKQVVSFVVYPFHGDTNIRRECVAEVMDRRLVMNSGGMRERRYCIRMPVTVGEQSWDVDVTLTNREPLLFRMLLGRDALRNRFVIDPAKSMCQGKATKTKMKRLY